MTRISPRWYIGYDMKSSYRRNMLKAIASVTATFAAFGVVLLLAINDPVEVFPDFLVPMESERPSTAKGGGSSASSGSALHLPVDFPGGFIKRLHVVPDYQVSVYVDSTKGIFTGYNISGLDIVDGGEPIVDEGSGGFGKGDEGLPSAPSLLTIQPRVRYFPGHEFDQVIKEGFKPPRFGIRRLNWPYDVPMFPDTVYVRLTLTLKSNRTLTIDSLEVDMPEHWRKWERHFIRQTKDIIIFGSRYDEAASVNGEPLTTQWRYVAIFCRECDYALHSEGMIEAYLIQ